MQPKETNFLKPQLVPVRASQNLDARLLPRLRRLM
jgi:hypothetical protein